MNNKIEFSKLKDILDQSGAMGLRVFIEYCTCMETLGHKPTIDELNDFSNLDKNTLLFTIGGLKELGIIKEKTPQEETMDIILESEFDDLIQKTINTFLVGGTFTSSSVKDLCIQTITQFVEDKIRNNPSKEYIYRSSLAKKLDLISRI